MDREHEEIRLLGFFGMVRESFKIVFSWRKIFSQITLTLILPLAFIFLAHIQISNLIFGRITTLEQTSYSYQYYHMVSSEYLAAYWLFQIGYFTILLILSLLSTSAVVYTVACIYTRKPISYKRVMSVVPRVWKRLMVTFLWSFFFVFIYNVVSIVILYLWFRFLLGNTIGIVFFFVLLIAYFIGFLYITIIWHLASVMSVLEEIYGLKSMVKSKNLIKGKLGVSAAFFILLGGCFAGIQILYEMYGVLSDWYLNIGIRIIIGIACLLLLLKVILFGLVIQTVLYFVCKSHHHEIIERCTLSEHLESYHGEYARLKAANVQMERMEV